MFAVKEKGVDRGVLYPLCLLLKKKPKKNKNQKKIQKPKQNKQKENKKALIIHLKRRCLQREDQFSFSTFA